MVGYSKWSKVKQIRGPLDVQRGAACGKLVKEITVAARHGDDQSGNPRLCQALETARPVDMSMDRVERASRKSTGEMREHITKKSFTKTAYPASVLHPYEVPENRHDVQNVYSHLAILEEAPVRRAA